MKSHSAVLFQEHGDVNIQRIFDYREYIFFVVSTGAWTWKCLRTMFTVLTRWHCVLWSNWYRKAKI